MGWQAEVRLGGLSVGSLNTTRFHPGDAHAARPEKRRQRPDFDAGGMRGNRSQRLLREGGREKDFPIADYRDDDAYYFKLEKLLHS